MRLRLCRSKRNAQQMKLFYRCKLIPYAAVFVTLTHTLSGQELQPQDSISTLGKGGWTSQRPSARVLQVAPPDLDGDGIYDANDLHPSIYDPPITITESDYTLTILGSGRVANLVVPAAVCDSLATSTSAGFGGQVSGLTKRLFEQFRDAFDFIMFVSDQDALPPAADYYGISTGVKNDTHGIGSSQFDSGTSYGASGKLQQVLHLAEKDGLRGGPSLHEIMHRWANHLKSVPTQTAGSDGSHWGFSGVGGHLGGWAPGTLKSLGNGFYSANDGKPGSTSFGTYANGGNTLPYAKLELYLMGMIPLSEVPDVQMSVNPAWQNGNIGTFTASAINTVTTAQIIATDGVRVPDYTASQKNFHALYVVVTKAPLSTARFASYDDDVQKFSLPGNDGNYLYNFWEATGGRATMDMGHLAYDMRSYIGPVISGPIAPPVGQFSNFQFTEVADATGYQWRQTFFAPFNQIEGAENGLINVTATTTGAGTGLGGVYNPIVTDVHHSGSASFHLAHPDFQTQKLLLNQTIRVHPASELQFFSRLGWATATDIAKVQVSADGGSWQTIWSQTGDFSRGENTFALHAISLAAFDGRQIRVQFIYEANGSYYPQATTGYGLYLDDITVIGAEQATNVLVSDVPVGTTFSFSPTHAAQYGLEVRARIGERLLPWGPIFLATPPAPPVASLRVVPDGGVNYGSIQSGQSIGRDFTITNISAVNIAGTASVVAPFSVTQGGSYSLTPGQSQTVKIRFSPSAPGKYSALVTFTGGNSTTRRVTGSAFTDPTGTSGSITGRVSRSDTHQPLNGVAITAIGPGPNLFNGGFSPGALTQGSGALTGRYTITGLLPNAHYHLLVVASDPQFYVKETTDIVVTAGQVTTADIALDPIPPDTQPPTLTPEETPVVLVRGTGADQDWTPHESSYWVGFRLALMTAHFQNIWDCNKPDNDPNFPIFDGKGHVINGEESVQQNSYFLDYYVRQKAKQFKRDKGFYPPTVNIIAHSMGALPVLEWVEIEPSEEEEDANAVVLKGAEAACGRLDGLDG